MKTAALFGLGMLALLSACGGGSDSSPPLNLPAGTERPSTVARLDSEYHDQVQQVHIAYLGAAADPVAQNFWAAKNNAAKLPVKIADLASAYNTDANARAYIDALANSKDSQEIYGGNNEIFLASVFKTLFNRNPSAVEKTQWLNQLDGGKLTRQLAPLLILGNAPAADADILKNKLVAARAVSAAINTRELSELFAAAPDALVVSRALLAAIPALPADNELLVPLAKAAVERFAADYQPIVLPLPIGGIHGYSGYLFRRAAAIMCSTVRGKTRVAGVQPLPHGQRLLTANDLATQEFNFHHSDCSDSAGSRRIAFDAAGNATLTGEGHTLRYTAAEVTAALNGRPIEDGVNNRKISFAAYGLPVGANGTSIVLAEKTVSAGAQGETLSAWSQP